jgi:hypothetical protein
MAAPAPIPLQINFMTIREPADIGVRRASVFLGLATNAAVLEPPLSHVLDDRVQYRFVPNEVLPATAAHFNEEFTYWVMGNALRELVDAFSTFLIRCRPYLRIMETKQINNNELDELSAAIESKNISQQYEEIQELVHLEPIYAEMFETFRQARNCLAHRRGVVAERDVNTNDGQFRLRWCFMGIFLREPDGTEQLIDNDTIGQGMTAGGDGGLIVGHLTWKERKFPVGTQIRLTRHDLGEICFGVYVATSHVMGKIHEFALAHGIPDASLERPRKPRRRRHQLPRRPRASNAKTSAAVQIRRAGGCGCRSKNSSVSCWVVTRRIIQRCRNAAFAYS